MLGRALGAPGLSPDARRSLHFAAACLLDKSGRYGEAFAHARLGNETFPRSHDPAVHSEWVSQRVRYFTRDRLRALADLKGRAADVLDRLGREHEALAPESLASLRALVRTLEDYGVDLDRVELDLGFGRGIGGKPSTIARPVPLLTSG